MDVNLKGYLPDPESPDYWSFEKRLLPRMGSANASGSIDLRQYSSPRHNQTTTSTCVAQSVVKALEIKRIMAGRPHVDLSVLHLYFLCRQRMNPPQTNQDAGTLIWLAADCIRKLGVCPESAWPFDRKKIYLNPGWGPLKEGSVNRIQAAYKIQNSGEDRVQSVIKALLAGNPVVYGTEIGEGWVRYRKGQTLSKVKAPQGSHATVLVGWTGTQFIGENSWGRSWGEEGFYFLDPEVVASEASQDFWTIQEGFESWAERGG